MFNLSGFWGGAKSSADRAADSLDAFASEQSAVPASRAPADPTAKVRIVLRNPPQSVIYLALGLVVVLASAAFLLYRWVSDRPKPAFAVVTIESDPGGALVLMQGIPKGITPLALSLPPGDHVFAVVHEGPKKSIRLSARPEATVVHHVQFDRMELPGAAPRPVSAPPAAPAPVATSAPGAVGGWVTVSTPIPGQIVENGQVVGSSASPRVMLPTGIHKLSFFNEALGYSAERTVQLAPGKTSAVTLNVPRAPLSINAVPWAEVWIDGVRVGETPIGNHMVTLGNHEILLRHPQFGERRQVATVGLKSPARVSVDLRKPQ